PLSSVSDGGRVCQAGARMARLGAVITEAIVHHYGRDEFLRRLAHPFWFQSFGFHGDAPCRFSDPARFSLAHGGKDSHPFPVPLRAYDESIRVLKSTVQNARLEREEELGAVMRLDQQARQLEVWAKAPSFEAVLTEERQASSAYGGGSVFCRQH